MKRFKLITKIIFIILITLLTIFVLIINRNPHFFTKDKQAKEGIYIANTDESRYLLDGEWEVYYNKFIISEYNEKNTFDEYVNIPEKVNNVEGDECYYASYRLVLTDLSVGSSFCIMLENLSCSYKAYVNNSLVSYSGVLSKNKDEIKCSGEGTIENNYYVRTEEPIEIIVEIASSFNSGLYKIPILYFNNGAHRHKMFEIIQKCILIGIVLFSIIVNSFRLTIEKKRKDIVLALIGLVVFLIYVCLNGELYSLIYNYYEFISAQMIDMILLIISCFGTGVVLLLITNNYNSKHRNAFIITHIVFSICTLLCSMFKIKLFTDNSMYINSIYLIFLCTVAMFGKSKRNDHVYFSNLLGSVGVAIFTATYLSILSNDGTLAISIKPVLNILVVYALIAVEYDYTMKISRGYKLLDETKRISDDNAQYKITLLLSQIKPHFLYNTLNTIKYLCKTNPAEAEEAILKFSTYLRSNMNSITEENLIPVSQELNHVQNYVDIEKIRFRERLEVIYNIQYTEFLIPPLTIQAIVENAIKHGVSKKTEGGQVLVETYATEDNIYIVVADTGVGFDTSLPKKETSLGLSNIKKRVELVFKGEMTIESVLKKGTKVTIRIPKNKPKIKKS